MKKQPTKKDESILNPHANRSINSFENMVSKFKKAGFKTIKLGLDSIEIENKNNEI
mgnify:CR=1 FL=1